MTLYISNRIKRLQYNNMPKFPYVKKFNIIHLQFYIQLFGSNKPMNSLLGLDKINNCYYWLRFPTSCVKSYRNSCALIRNVFLKFFCP